jgi:large subunit ribosomal protein L1
MAKKKEAATEAEGQATPAAEEPKAAKAEGEKKPKGEKAKGEKPAKAPKGEGEKTPRGPKAEADQSKAPRAEGAPAGEGKSAEAPVAPAAAGAPGEAAKKKRRPGFSPRRGKKLRKRLNDNEQTIAKLGQATLEQAVDSLKKMKRAKFDETVEVHMALGVDVTQSDQLVRGTVSLPHGIGKSVRVLVFCQGDNIPKAQAAGADHVGDDELIKKVQGGWTDFDVALATQDMMGKVSRLGKILGPRGLMPTPKAGTVITTDIAAAIKEFKAGKVEYRTDKTGNIHAGVGKLSFDVPKLVENIHTFVEQVRSVKPAGVKGQYIKSVYLSATMSPSIHVTV